jgi:hypothetical protein
MAQQSLHVCYWGNSGRHLLSASISLLTHFGSHDLSPDRHRLQLRLSASARFCAKSNARFSLRDQKCKSGPLMRFRQNFLSGAIVDTLRLGGGWAGIGIASAPDVLDWAGFSAPLTISGREQRRVRCVPFIPQRTAKAKRIDARTPDGFGGNFAPGSPLFLI